MPPGGPMGGIAPHRWPLLTPVELAALCPVDGPIARTHRPRTQPILDLDAEVRSIASRLDNDGERSWSRMLLKAFGHPAGQERLTYIGHALAIVLRHGPMQRPSIGVSTDEVEQLLLDTVAR
jgi:hypothetical protein